ncbi:MAG: hypothetical protein KatS3mg115_0714 [Candidatus Poribacteria bacterium]|nr:MAG: hypothetical protein KatS3mg115_0714 [Candidatus Poribacteria bacterium]
MSAHSIPGYTYGTDAVPPAPIALGEFQQMAQVALFGEEDVRYLRMAHEVLKDQVEEILDVWYGFVGSVPHLLYYFTRTSDGQPDETYLSRVRQRFGRWILDTTRAEYDQAWLDYQFEIGRRHHREKKNQTDGVDAPEIVPFRYMIPLIYPIVATIRPFLAKGGHDSETVEKMHQAWTKSVILQLTLWSYPYVREGDF